MIAFRPTLIVLSALALASATTLASAAEDGGTLSPFAYGAGNRALAMGGAYTAIAEDASALFWNPAGLGNVPRSELQFGASMLQLGAQETFAAAAVPSLRWGTLGVNLWHFGVGGIDARDDRNARIDSDLKDSEDEFTLGWGQSLGPWNIGAAVRMQHQNLAGFGDAGLGADLGVTVRPLALLRANAADPLTLGLSVRNAVRPTLRLERDGVPDPSRIRTGLAWRSHWGVVSADVEGGGGAGMVPRLGMEWRPHGLLAVRTGINDGQLTAGGGMRWNNLNVDYAYENGEVVAVHRVSVTLAIGRTVSENRALALQREEERIRARVAQGYREVEEQRAAELVARIRSLLETGQPAEALDVIGTLETLRPDHPELATLAARVLLERARVFEQQGDFAAAAAAYRQALERTPGDSTAAQGERRTRAESDARAARALDLRATFASAMDAFAAGDLAKARRGFQRVLAAAPSDTEAVEMLWRVERSTAQRIEDALRAAREAIALGRFEVAELRLDDVRALDPSAAGIVQTERALTAARDAGRRAPVVKATPAAPALPATASVRELSPRKRRELDDLYRRGLEALATRRSDDAIRYWELVRSEAPDYPRLAQNLVQEYLRRGLDEFASGDLERAMERWQKALAIDPSDPRTQGYLERVQRQLTRRRELLGVSP